MNADYKTNMPFGLGSKLEAKKSLKTKGKNTQAQEAAQLLKKMEAKKEAGDCPFC